MTSISSASPGSACLPIDVAPHPLYAAAVAVLEPRPSSGGLSFEQILRSVERSLGESPALRRWLGGDEARDGEMEVDRRAWSKHVQAVTPEEAVSERALCALVGELSARPLDPDRPQWMLYVIEGLFGGLVAAVLVTDLGLADPRTCTEALRHLLGLAPKDETRPSHFERSVPWPSPATIDPSEDVAFPTDPTARRWSGPLSDARMSAYARSHRAAVDVVQRAFGGTCEDVTLAACTRALRRYLQAHGDAVDEPLVAVLPTEPGATVGERAFVRYIQLPVQIADPVDQLRIIQSETCRAHTAPQIAGRRWLGVPCTVASPDPIPAGSSGPRPSPLLRRHQLVFRSLTGADRTLYLGTARVVALHPHGPLFEGAGLDLSVIRYGNSIDFGLMACPDRVPDAVEITAGIEAAVADLVKRAFEEREGSLELGDWSAGA